MPRDRRHLLWATGALLLASLLFGGFVGSGSRRAEDVAVGRAERGVLDVRVIEMGTLVAPRSVTIASEIQSNRAKVVRLLAEGSLVRDGDVLVEFDAAPFLEDVTKYTRALKEADANRQQVRQDLELAKAKREQIVQDAEARARLAKLELTTLENGGGPLSVQEAKARVDQAEEQWRHASEGAADAEAFLGEGFITRKEYEEAFTRLSETRRAKALAVAQYDNLVKFRQPADLERARVALERAEKEHARAGETAVHEIARQQALLAKAEMAVEAAQSDLDKARGELANAKIASPASGFLVYNEIPVGSDYRRIQIGDSVWQGQAIMTIPDTSQMAVETSVREFDVHKVHPGQKARVKLEAFPGLTLDGQIEFIGNLATRRGAEGGDKQFSLRVLLTKTDPRLRPGMTAEVEIGVEQVRDALLVPIEAVFQQGGRSVCWVRDGGDLVEREVQLGSSNEDRVAILSGLRDGDVVSLLPRPDRSWPWSR
jgi:HlyD family secretion protein